MDIQTRIIKNFDYLKESEDGMPFAYRPYDEDEETPNIQLSALGKRIMDKVKEKDEVERLGEPKKKVKAKAIDPEEVLSVDDFLAERHERKDWRHERHHTGKMATSVTSTYMKVETVDEKRTLSDMEMMQIIWHEIKTYHYRSYLQIVTNLGEMNITLFSDQTVRTCNSFLDMAYKGIFNGMKFKKLIPGTILLMENAMSRGIKFDTVDRSEKLLHNKPYLLTVDTLGDLNTFGFTVGQSYLLDRTNSVFGEVITGTDILELIDAAGETNGHPHKHLEIISIRVMEDAYRQTCKKIRRKLLGIDEEEEKKKAKKEKSEFTIEEKPTTLKIISM